MLCSLWYVLFCETCILKIIYKKHCSVINEEYMYNRKQPHKIPSSDSTTQKVVKGEGNQTII